MILQFQIFVLVQLIFQLYKMDKVVRLDLDHVVLRLKKFQIFQHLKANFFLIYQLFFIRKFSLVAVEKLFKKKQQNIYRYLKNIFEISLILFEIRRRKRLKNFSNVNTFSSIKSFF
jgi:hypothetical protein